MMLVFSDCTAFSAELSVVVLPLPVGPTTRIMPCWWRRNSRTSSSAAADMPISSSGGHALAVIEHAHHDLLAEQRAQRRDAEVDLGAVLRRRAETAVLRQPLLGDVHAGHDLEARDQPLVDPLGQVHHFLEQAVEAVADEDAFLHRLDVDVARLALDRALHDEIDEVDDRRRFAALLEAGDRLEARPLRPAAPAPSRRRGTSTPGAPRAAPRGRGHRELAAAAGVARISALSG